MRKTLTMKLINKIALSALTFGTMLSCTKRDNLGPEIKTASDAFQIEAAFETNTSTLNYALIAQPIKFRAKFNEEVSWTVRLEGARSGAYWESQGLSNEIIDGQVEWTGQSSSINNFLFQERIGATLSILGHDSVYSVDSLEISTMPEFRDFTQTINGVKQVLIDDFDDRFAKIDDLAAGMAPDQNDVNVSFKTSEEIVLSGNASYYMRGQDVNDNSWSGGINSATLLEFYRGQDSLELPVDSGVNPKDLYFNMYIYGTGKPNTSIQMKVYELDAKVGTVSENVNSVMDIYDFANEQSAPDIYSNVYNQGQNDGYIFDIEVTWTGWKLVSVPYSDFRVANDPGAGGNGDRVKESFRIVGFGVSLLSFPTSGQLTEAYIDRITMSYGGRYQKRK
jgi:hypothetical protein